MVTVPYEDYTSKRKQYGWKRKDPIVFYTAGTLGISLENALRHQSRGLEDPFDPVLQGCGDKVSHYINVCVWYSCGVGMNLTTFTAVEGLLGFQRPKVLVLPETRPEVRKYPRQGREAGC